jgi:hypothetical protein
MSEEKSYTESAISDVFKTFFNQFKINGDYKYISLIDSIIGNLKSIEIDYNDLTDELKNIIKQYPQAVIHKVVYRAIVEVLQIRIGSSVDGMKDNDLIKFQIINYDKFHNKIFGKPNESHDSVSIDDDEELSATVKVYNVGENLIVKQYKSENDTEQIVVKIKLNGKPHWIDVYSPTFDQMIRVNTQAVYGDIFADSTYRTGIKNLHANALLNGTETRPVFSRSALINNCLYYDLQNLNGTVFRITKDVIEKIPVDDEDTPIFLKSPSAKTKQSMQVEPLFDDSSALDEFVKLCRIQEQDKIVFKSHLIAFFLTSIPIPILILHGEQGSAKTSSSGGIKSLIDPEGENAFSLPENVDDLAIILSKHHISNFDNMDNFSKEISQFLCKAVTGTQYPKRLLYTTAEEFSLTLKSKIILNGINPTINQPDLLERSIFYELPRIDKTERMTDEDFKNKIDELRPHVLGMVFTTLQKAMNTIDAIKGEMKGTSLPRMASFAIWGEAISRALGHQDNAFIERYWEKIDDSNLSLNEEYPIIPLLIDFMKRKGILGEDKKIKEFPQELTISKLHNEIIGNDWKDNKLLPPNSNVLSKQIKAVIPNFRTIGYEISMTKYNNKDGIYPRGSHIIKITPISSEGMDGYTK